MEYGTQILGSDVSFEVDGSPVPDSNNIYHLDDEDVIKYLINKGNDKPYALGAKKESGFRVFVIKCGASWCGPCQACAPHYEKWAKEYKYKDIAFCSLDIDNTEQFTELFNAVPAWIFIDHTGKIQKEIIMGAHVPGLIPIKKKVYQLLEEASNQDSHKLL